MVQAISDDLQPKKMIFVLLDFLQVFDTVWRKKEEACALELAITWINEHCSAISKILICTDSKSLCQKLSDSSALISDL